MATETVDAIETFKTYFELSMPMGVDVKFEGDTKDGAITLLITCETRDHRCTQHIDVERIRNTASPRNLAAAHATAFRGKLLGMEAEHE